MIAESALSARFWAADAQAIRPAGPARCRACCATIAHVWVALAGAFCLFDMIAKAVVGWTDGDGRPIGDDFINYFSGAFLALHQRAAEIYHWPAYHAFQEQLVGAAVSPNYNYSYPPVLLVLTLPFARCPICLRSASWLIGGWYAFYRALRLGDADTRCCSRSRRRPCSSTPIADRTACGPRRSSAAGCACCRARRLSPACCSDCRSTSRISR